MQSFEPYKPADISTSACNFLPSLEELFYLTDGNAMVVLEWNTF